MMSSTQISSPTSLSVLYRLAQTVLTAQDETEVLKLVVDAPVSVLGAYTVSLFPLLSDGSVGDYVAAGRGAGRVQQLTREQFDEGLSGWVVRERRLAVSPEGQSDPRESLEARDRRWENACGHIVVLPLQHQDTMLGTLTIISELNGQMFTPDELEWFEALANLAAVSMIQHRLNTQVLRLAPFDTLTTLPSRSLLDDRLAQALARTADDRTPCALLQIGLDDFQKINDTFGQEVGDRALRTTAARLRASVRGTDTVARLDGDRFVVVLNGLREANDALLVAEKLRLLIRIPMNLPGATVTLEASIGVSVAPDHAHTPQELSDLAAHAMHQAKQDGRNLVRLAGS